MKNPLRLLAAALALLLLASCSFPSWLTYTNTTYNFQFQYPNGSTIITDTPTSARLQLPITDGTNLSEKFLDVSVEAGAIPCLSPYSLWNHTDPPVAPVVTTQDIGEISWLVEHGSEGAMGSIYEWTAYSTYDHDACISLVFVLHSHPTDLFVPTLPAFDPSGESAVFSLIMATFTWLTSLPTCATDSLMAPALVDPVDGSDVNTLDPILHWSYLDACAPEGYRIDLSTDPTFADTSLSGGTGNPSTSWMPAESLTDCTTYFWQVAPINDTTLGPFSNTFTFRTNVSGTCPPEAPASISGMIWQDGCPVPLDISPIPSPIPACCVEDSYGIDADGIYTPGEPPLPDIPVYLGPGDCPISGPGSTTTDGSGAYSFTGLAPGKYCLNVNGVSIVGPDGLGHWTLVQGGHEGNSYRLVLLGAGQDLTDQDFAWYWGGVTTPTPTPTATPTPVADGPFFIPDINVNCHFGDGINFGIYDFAMKGTPYLLDGRNAENTWYRIMFTRNMGCWVLQTTGHTSGDISRMRVLFSVATPTPVCSLYTSKDTCSAAPHCTWSYQTSRPGACIDK